MKKLFSMALVAALTMISEDLCGQSLRGAWESTKGDTTILLIASDNYISMACYNESKKEFYWTMGGRILPDDKQISAICEFNSRDKSVVGNEFRLRLNKKGDPFISLDSSAAWKKLDDGSTNLAGNWRITQREQEGKMQAIHTTGPRKTIKILSSTRFQWAAINTETGEFFGSGGGSYDFRDGKYTEHIRFFSRDNSRVGMSLTFNGKLDEKDWHHAGKSSKGDPINEVWSR
jgi:hypothetical protein